jgi:transcriptional repressor NrdR
VQCPSCGSDDTQVTETRPAPKNELRRRRVCQACKQRFTTREQIAAPQLKVEKRRGSSEPYDRAKLHRALVRVCSRRPVTEATIDELVNRVEARLTKAQLRTVGWARMVELVLDVLRPVDAVAARRMEADYLDEAGAVRLSDAPAAEEGAGPQLGLFGDDDA